MRVQALASRPRSVVEETNTVSTWECSTQLLKGTLDMCLLATIAQRPCYGYELVQQLAGQGLSLVSEGSIYPLLSRLQHLGYIEGYLVASRDGPQRKYY